MADVIAYAAPQMDPPVKPEGERGARGLLFLRLDGVGPTALRMVPSAKPEGDGVLCFPLSLRLDRRVYAASRNASRPSKATMGARAALRFIHKFEPHHKTGKRP